MDLESHVTQLIENINKQKNWGVPADYFNWNRDNRHKVNDTETWGIPHFPKDFLNDLFKKIRPFFFRRINEIEVLSQFRKQYASFDESYRLMSDCYSQNLFAELILMKLVSEKNMCLSSFTHEFISSYENASGKMLSSNEKFIIYSRVLRKISLDSPPVSFFTLPAILNLHYTGRLYRYCNHETLIEVEGGDIVIDAGVGWGDTTIYLAALAGKGPEGHLFAFDILEEGMNALSEQCRLNLRITNITPILKAISDKDGEQVFISLPSPGARVVDEKTKRNVETITIDTFSTQNNIKRIDFIKMDIEGSEVPALIGATATIRKCKPKLAVCVYHKWDDLLVIPQLIHSIRNDYRYYLDCTTGFGGEAILYCI